VFRGSEEVWSQDEARLVPSSGGLIDLPVETRLLYFAAGKRERVRFPNPVSSGMDTSFGENGRALAATVVPSPGPSRCSLLYLVLDCGR